MTFKKAFHQTMTNSDQQWNIPPENITLQDNEVHVWRASLNTPLADIEALKRLLSDEEVTRAERFYFEKGRHGYIVAHGILRILLGRYLTVDPRQLRFQTNAYGKPSLENTAHNRRLHFNLSHSHELAAYAFTAIGEVGIDIEYTQTHVEYEELAKHSFSPYESAVLHDLPESMKQEAFFNCWTRKEAYIKARGMGLSLPLHLFDVSLKPGEPAALLHSRENAQEVTRWTFEAMTMPPEYAGALAVEGHGWDARYWQWE
ncbi:MAG TPA: 4'-phosphopantetheinyl transferase superfamily protein [Ktedonobacteraceae bacterium]|nr:4'-phosphopantetheinyl transferase superfamily protein [Ktedonobacteraceae bacterium]